MSQKIRNVEKEKKIQVNEWVTFKFFGIYKFSKYIIMHYNKIIVCDNVVSASIAKTKFSWKFSCLNFKIMKIKTLPCSIIIIYKK